MRFNLKKREPGELEFGIIYGGIAFLALLAGRFLPLLDLAPSCVFRSLTGLPCPTCGSTRAIVLLAHGDIPTALSFNPLTGIGAIAAVLSLFYGLIAFAFDVPRLNFVLTEREKNGIRASVLLFLFLNWTYLFSAL